MALAATGFNAAAGCFQIAAAAPEFPDTTVRKRALHHNVNRLGGAPVLAALQPLTDHADHRAVPGVDLRAM